ncbi:MAG TPA: GNAT family N-acetyltransferase [Firmicutes bacterium]|nr:GNAT family N-acetyltransferase [Bacillota bacterium]
MPEVRIRPVRPEDAEAINEVRRQPGVREFTYALPSERVADNHKFFENLGPDDHVLVVEVDGRAVGIGGLHVQKSKRRHVGEVGLSIHDDFQNQGLGRALLAALLDLADNYLGLRRVELETWADNARAIHLYESLGFVVEGRKRQAVFRRGEYLDVLIMGRLKG